MRTKYPKKLVGKLVSYSTPRIYKTERPYVEMNYCRVTSVTKTIHGYWAVWGKWATLRHIDDTKEPEGWMPLARVTLVEVKPKKVNGKVAKKGRG